jgi:hypothetical protein
MPKKYLLILITTLTAACGDQAYKLVNVPYCQVAPGTARGAFTEDIRWVYSAGDGRGTGPLAGGLPSMGVGVSDAVRDDDMLLAIVACPAIAAGGFAVTTVSSDPRNPGDELTLDRVPALCPGQRVLFHGAVTATDDAAAKAKGYTGVVRLPDLEVACAAGAVTRTTSADIEPRPK